MEDQHTIGYFNRNTPEYSDYRLKHVLEAINRHATAGPECAEKDILDFVQLTALTDWPSLRWLRAIEWTRILAELQHR